MDEVTAERIEREFRPTPKSRWRPADEFALSSLVLRRFASDTNPRMRCLAPRDPDLPVDLAAQLAADPDHSVRQAVAAHPNLPTHALTTLLADSNEWVARAAAASPSLPVAEMERLLQLAGL